MIIEGHIYELEATTVPEEHAKNMVRRVVFGKDRGWSSHVLRVFTVGENGGTYEHEHEWPHHVYILRGKGRVVIAGKEQFVEHGHFMYIPENVSHCFENANKEPFEFLCIVPPEGDVSGH